MGAPPLKRIYKGGCGASKNPTCGSWANRVCYTNSVWVRLEPLGVRGAIRGLSYFWCMTCRKPRPFFWAAHLVHGIFLLPTRSRYALRERGGMKSCSCLAGVPHDLSRASPWKSSWSSSAPPRDISCAPCSEHERESVLARSSLSGSCIGSKPQCRGGVPHHQTFVRSSYFNVRAPARLTAGLY